MLFNPNRLVIFQRGRYAGCKAVVIKNDGEDKFVTVTGMSLAPKTTTSEMPEKTKTRRNKMRVFVKKMNPKHLILTRYNSKLDFNGVEVTGAFEDNSIKKNVAKSCEEVFRNAFDCGKEQWLFTKLKF